MKNFFFKFPLFSSASAAADKDKLNRIILKENVIFHMWIDTDNDEHVNNDADDEHAWDWMKTFFLPWLT